MPEDTPEPPVWSSNGGDPSPSDPVNVITSTDPEPAVETTNGGHEYPADHPLVRGFPEEPPAPEHDPEDGKPSGVNPAAEPEEEAPVKPASLIPPDAETATSTVQVETA